MDTIKEEKIKTDDSLALNGWKVIDIKPGIEFETQKDLKSFRLGANPKEDTESYLLVDPKLAETTSLVWDETNETVESMGKNGWKSVYQDPTGGLFVRTKPDAIANPQ